MYFRNKVIIGADPDSFEVISISVVSGFYAKDKDHVYKFSEIIEGADPDTFKH